ncbi:MAG: phenylalanine--tRNA ligase subunit beta, partial [Nitrososphaerales archaeon]
GLELNAKQTIECLRRSRIPAKLEGNQQIVASVPRYRFDMLHEVDLVEEIVIGYGVNNIQPTFPEGAVSGARESRQIVEEGFRKCLSGLGLLEVLSFSLVGKDMLSSANQEGIDSMMKVTDPKTSEHEILREALLPSVLSILSKNIHKEYPQKIFEISTVFSRNENIVTEHRNLVVALAHTSANFTDVNSYLTSTLSQTVNVHCNVRAAKHPMFVEGRTGSVFHNDLLIGYVGEVLPTISENFGLRVPVSAFEISLEPFL